MSEIKIYRFDYPMMGVMVAARHQLEAMNFYAREMGLGGDDVFRQGMRLPDEELDLWRFVETIDTGGLKSVTHTLREELRRKEAAGDSFPCILATIIWNEGQWYEDKTGEVLL